MKKYKVTVNGQQYDVSVEELGGVSAPLAPTAAAAPPLVSPAAPAAPAAPAVTGSGTIRAPMPGTVISVRVSVGQAVKRGDVILILEAMKMENEICATMDGVVSALRVQAGASVNTGDPMLDLA
ncbi:MAG: biotin/lipoyl-binding protein [Spirochaetes bacterium]|nr:biotin/lipoyl-binding protein [Spirochaetota bacterium]